jgi:hypothetical protein
MRLCTGGSAVWWIGAQLLRASALIAPWLSGRKRAGARQAAPAPSTSTVDAPATAQQPGKQGKSIKQLLKEKQKANAAANTLEVLPDSHLFLTSLKGHGGAVTSVDISSDDSHILTACEDQVSATCIA